MILITLGIKSFKSAAPRNLCLQQERSAVCHHWGTPCRIFEFDQTSIKLAKCRKLGGQRTGLHCLPEIASSSPVMTIEIPNLGANSSFHLGCRKSREIMGRKIWKERRKSEVVGGWGNVIRLLGFFCILPKRNVCSFCSTSIGKVPDCPQVEMLRQWYGWMYWNWTLLRKKTTQNSFIRYVSSRSFSCCCCQGAQKGKRSMPHRESWNMPSLVINSD